MNKIQQRITALIEDIEREWGADARSFAVTGLLAAACDQAAIFTVPADSEVK